MNAWCIRVALFDDIEDKRLGDLQVLEGVGHVTTTETGVIFDVRMPDRSTADQIVAVLTLFGINAVVAPRWPEETKANNELRNGKGRR